MITMFYILFVYVNLSLVPIEYIIFGIFEVIFELVISSRSLYG